MTRRGRDEAFNLTKQCVLGENIIKVVLGDRVECLKVKTQASFLSSPSEGLDTSYTLTARVKLWKAYMLSAL